MKQDDRRKKQPEQASGLASPAPAKSSEASAPTLKHLGGSLVDDWNRYLTVQAVQSHWSGNRDAGSPNIQLDATMGALNGIAPRGELEAMMAAQLIAAHNAAMECFRRAMIPEQSVDGRRENLNQANKLMRSWAMMLDSLNKHRGKGQQKVTVEHVHVHAGGQAVVGTVEAQGGGMRNPRNNPMQGSLRMHLSPRCGARTRTGTPCRCPAMENGRCRMHGGKSPGAPVGNSNARKHGHYSADAATRRRQVASLLREMKALMEEIDGAS